MRNLEELRNACYVCPDTDCWYVGGKLHAEKPRKGAQMVMVYGDRPHSVARASLIFRGAVCPNEISRQHAQHHFVATTSCGFSGCANHVLWATRKSVSKGKVPKNIAWRLKMSAIMKAQRPAKIKKTGLGRGHGKGKLFSKNYNFHTIQKAKNDSQSI
jgi:hypothetical protein